MRVLLFCWSGLLLYFGLLVIAIWCPLPKLTNKRKATNKKHNRGTGVMNAAESYRCDTCGKDITRDELSRNWDWGGPHCPYCGNGGISMFASVVEQDCPNGIQSSRFFINGIIKWLNSKREA